MSRDSTSFSLWKGVDRKAMAVAEFTLKQQRKRLSTWVVLGVGFAAMAILTMFYIDGMVRDYEAIDNPTDKNWSTAPTSTTKIHILASSTLQSNQMTPAYGSMRTPLIGTPWWRAVTDMTTMAIVAPMLGRPLKKTRITTAYPVMCAWSMPFTEGAWQLKEMSMLTKTLTMRHMQEKPFTEHPFWPWGNSDLSF